MMRIVQIVVLSLLGAAVVLAAGAVIFVKTFDVNKYKPQIIAQANTALNRRVDFDRARLDISLKQGVNIKISDLVIGEDPSFGEGDFLRIKEISAAIDVIGYLLRKQINVPDVRIDTPRVTIIRQKDGSINAASFGAAAPEGSSAESAARTAARTAAAVNAPQKAFALPEMLISSVRLENGAVTYIDRSFDPAVTLDVTDIFVTVSRISLSEPFPFTLEAAVLALKKNIRVDGNVRVDPASNEITVSGLNAQTELADIVMAKIPVALPMTAGMPLPESVKGLIRVKLDSLTAGAKGMGPFHAAVNVSDGAVRMKEISSSVHGISADIGLTQADAALNKASLSIGSGAVECSGALKDYAGAQKYSMSADIRGLNVREIIAQDDAPFKVEGVVSGTVKAAGEGFSADAVRSNLSATADMSLSKARLVDLNILRAVLDRISIIPGLSGAVEAGLPQELKKKLTQKDTAFLDMKLPVVVENGRVLIRNTAIASDEFIFKGQAQAGFDKSYSLEGDFLITEGFSGAMAAAVPQLQYLLNDEKQIYIPLKVSGTASQIRFSVDLDYIGKRLLENQAKQQVFKALDKALGGSPQPGTGDAAGQEAGQDSASAVKEAVGSIIGNIFGK
ncbi:MAG: AsmA family protein [Candidatus Omnitrophica bacterium]|nr:AsmA family protein [Candidatus Omnitrophota bacterium]